MAKAYKMNATVLPGHRIEITAPEVAVGRTVEVIVVEESTAALAPTRGRAFLDSLPRIHHTEEEWVEIDRQFQAERDAWDR